MNRFTGPILSLICFLAFFSCVSRKKYEASESREQDLMVQNTRLAGEITGLKGQVEGLQTENGKLVKQIDDALKKASSASGMANMTQKQLEEEQQRLGDLRRLLQQQKEGLENLRQKMAAALNGFTSNELQVFTRNGRVYVSLQENLLFPSGSAVVNTKGKQALGSLAGVLNANPDINVVVEGHTDSLPIHGKYEDNWALSVARATAIVRILTETYQVDPVRVTASGRSRYEPVEGNNTAAGRQHNRRTEIILAPKLDELQQLLQENPPGDSTRTR
ncbi:MAG: OmpA family protein [Flavisolibacter sp.]